MTGQEKGDLLIHVTALSRCPHWQVRLYVRNVSDNPELNPRWPHLL